MDWGGWYRHAKDYHDVEYEVSALVSVPHAISYRYYGSDEFVLGADVFAEDIGTIDVMLYAYDTTDEANADMESFLQTLTNNIQTWYDYESKQTYAEIFYSFRDMFAILGGVLCFIIGLVGVLNFLNAVLTGILARRCEFAVLQAIGMAGKQLKSMLVWEGLFYTLGSTAVTAVLCIVTSPFLHSVLENVFWFFSYRFTIIPVLAVVPVFAALGAFLPLSVYRFAAKKPVVDRLQE